MVGFANSESLGRWVPDEIEKQNRPKYKLSRRMKKHVFEVPIMR